MLIQLTTLIIDSRSDSVHLFLFRNNFCLKLTFFIRSVKRVEMFVLFVIFKTSKFRSKKTDYVV